MGECDLYILDVDRESSIIAVYFLSSDHTLYISRPYSSNVELSPGGSLLLNASYFCIGFKRENFSDSC